MGDCVAVSRALPAKRHVCKTLPFHKNAADGGMSRKNTVGVLSGGAGLCGWRYFRRTHCPEPHGGTVSLQTTSRKQE